jgi:hypothetical protein
MWMTVIAWLWKASIDPITGTGTPGYLGWVGFHGLLAAATAAVGLKTPYRWIALPLLALTIFLAVPTPSKAGVRISLHNPQPTPVEVTIARSASPQRMITRTVPADATVEYQTAAGDFSEELPIVIKSPTPNNELLTTLGMLRTHRLVLRESGWTLDKK